MIPHQHVQCFVSFDGIIDSHLQEVTVLRVHGRIPQLFCIHLSKPFITLDAWFWRVRDGGQVLFQFLISIEIFLFFALLHLIQRRLCNIHISSFNQRTHVAIEQRQQQRTDMRAIDIGIGHDD
ncbi:hypothetical protein SDC9_176547 [bioreactor metagenome]|uniref:Uncharacterized protein n=1 Tax=bioreactor metagenome TaxID=1076179 RepID=A0A645GSA5_9ZZZZ